jgi:cytochrome o ubiquinol oxidase subunit 2
MKKAFKIALIVLICIATIALSVYYIFNHNIAVLEPKGWIGEKERNLISTASLLMLIVVIPVFILTWIFAWKYREGNEKSLHAPDWEHNYIAEYCWWGVPIIIVGILAVMCWKSSHELHPFKPIENGKKPIVIQVVSLEWKWLFIYPEHGIATINYVQFPEQTPINFQITSDAPMNSFWIPQLGGQIYAMPAMRSELHLIANELGTFRGASANLSGKGFAGMYFTAKSCTEAEFHDWVSSIKKSNKHLGLREYDQLLVPTEYHPFEYFVLDSVDLFEQILMKYMAPTQKK